MDKAFIHRPAHVTDIFEALNRVNLSFQRPTCTVVEFSSRLECFHRKLDLWEKNAKNNCYGMFEHLSTLERSPGDEVSHDVMDHLSLPKSELMHYFPDITCCAYVTDLYSVDPADLPVGTEEQEKLIDIQADQLAKRLLENS